MGLQVNGHPADAERWDEAPEEPLRMMPATTEGLFALGGTAATAQTDAEHVPLQFPGYVLVEPFARGKLDQTCPCGVTEAAGGYCTRCLRPMGETDWHPIRRSEAQQAAATAAGRRLRVGRPVMAPSRAA